MAAKVKIVEPEFRVPSFSDVHEEFRALAERHQKVNVELGENRRAQSDLEADLKRNPAVRAVRQGLADILGDAVEVDGRPARLNELKKRERDLEEAAGILFQRQRDLRGAASARVCDAVRPEFARRAAVLVSALEAAQVARLHFENLIAELESEDVTWQSRLGLDRLSWMGDSEGGHVARFLKAAKEQGYV